MSAFAFFLFLYTLGIFYIIIAGLATPSSLTDDDVSKYGIDKVSGFCGPGSWAAWLFTAAACCLSRLLRDSNSYNDTYTSTAALDLDLVATFAYPCIAAGDAILRLQNAASDTLSSSNLGCIATPLIVVKTGAGVCVLLAMICTRNWKQKSGRGISASFASVSALFLVYSAVAFDIIIAGIPPRNILAGVLFLLSPVYPPSTPQSTSLSKLLFASGLLSPAITGLSDIPFSQPKDLSKPIPLYFAYTFIGLTLVFNSNLGQPKMSLATPFIFFLPIVCFHIALWTSIILVQFALSYFVYQH